MTQYVAIDPEMEVNGETVRAIVNGMDDKRLAYEILEKNGIKDPQPGKWYSQQSWLDAFREIGENVGDDALKKIGNAIPHNAQWPPDVDDVDKALASIDVAYHMNHRKDGVVLFNPETGEMKEGIGHYGWDQTGEKEGRMRCDNPYPCPFDLGIIEAAAEKFAKEKACVQVIHEEGECRNMEKGDCCTYIIKW
jgi:hypothetical protein